MISNLFLESFGDKLMNNSWTAPYGFLWKPNENAHGKLFNVRHTREVVWLYGYVCEHFEGEGPCLSFIGWTSRRELETE